MADLYDSDLTAINFFLAWMMMDNMTGSRFVFSDPVRRTNVWGCGFGFVYCNNKEINFLCHTDDFTFYLITKKVYTVLKFWNEKKNGVKVRTTGCLELTERYDSRCNARILRLLPHRLRQIYGQCNAGILWLLHYWPI